MGRPAKLWYLTKRKNEHTYLVRFTLRGKGHAISTGQVHEDDAELEAVKIYAQFRASGRYSRPRRLVTVRNRVGIHPWPGFAGVYAASAVGCKYVKIGRAGNVAQRLRHMQIHWPTRVELLAILSRNPDDERKFHEQFELYHRRGEWFRPNEELSALIVSSREAGLHLPDMPAASAENDNVIRLAR